MASVPDYENRLQQFEGHGRHFNEVERRDHVTPPPNSPEEIAGHASFRDHEVELG